MGLHVVVLAGGSGTRLWPLSRSAVPKHLLPLGPGGMPLLRATAERVLPMGCSVHVVTVASQVDACREALDGVGPVGVIAEPVPRGTGPALGLAVRTIAREDPDAVICSVHADHHVGDAEGYRAALWSAAGWARRLDGLVTVGITPAYPSTGLGYVALGGRLDPAGWRPPVAPEPPGTEGTSAAARALAAHEAAGFVEKPRLATAEAYVAGGRHLWNTGLFAWPAAVFEAELRAASEPIDAGIAATVAARAAGDEEEARHLYAALPSVAVDPLVLERTVRLTVVQADFGWSDLGSWADLFAAWTANGLADSSGNVLEGDAAAVDARNCLVSSRGGRLVAVVGVDDLVVVDVGDAVLVVPRSCVQAVRSLVERLREAGREDVL